MAATDQVPYPTPVQGKNKSDSVTASLTHVFNPTMTNEFVFGYTYIGFPNVFEDPSKVNRGTVGYNYKGLYKNGVSQIPSFGGNGWQNAEAALVFNPGGFEAGGASAGLYADKWMPSFSDTVTKVWSTHTIRRASSGNGSATRSRLTTIPMGIYRRAPATPTATAMHMPTWRPAT